MAVVTKAVLKTYFEDGKEPDENKFIDLIDTLGGGVDPLTIFHTAWLNFPGIAALWNTYYHRASVDRSISILPSFIDLTHFGGVTRNRYYGVPTWAFASSASRYLRNGDIIALKFSGTEGYIATNDRGMAIGGWFYIPGTGNWGVSSMGLIGKWGGSGNFGYLLQIGNDKKARVFISSSGAAYDYVTTPTELDPLKWYFIVGKFRTTNGRIEVFVNGNEYYTESGYSSIYPSTNPFLIGAYSDPITDYFDGRVSGAFACGMHVSFDTLNAYYEQTKGIFEDQEVLGDPP